METNLDERVNALENKCNTFGAMMVVAVACVVFCVLIVVVHLAADAATFATIHQALKEVGK